jgi:hypothetical protein
MTSQKEAAMAAHQIVCVETTHPHRHITHVGIGELSWRASERWTVNRVRDAIRDGDRFYTVSPSTRKAADVRPDTCRIGGCVVETIRSAPDAVTDNNLDNLRVCRWTY